jgi:uncharacterized protein (DUF4415 family)
MNASKTITAHEWQDPDDAPDLSTPEWKAKFDALPVTRGRPKLDRPKISTTLRLDADIIDQFRAGGPGWQSRMNDVLRDWLSKNSQP